jgi:hypothetical protein
MCLFLAVCCIAGLYQESSASTQVLVKRIGLGFFLLLDFAFIFWIAFQMRGGIQNLGGLFFIGCLFMGIVGTIVLAISMPFSRSEDATIVCIDMVLFVVVGTICHFVIAAIFAGMYRLFVWIGRRIIPEHHRMSRNVMNTKQV